MGNEHFSTQAPSLPQAAEETLAIAQADHDEMEAAGEFDDDEEDEEELDGGDEVVWREGSSRFVTSYCSLECYSS